MPELHKVSLYLYIYLVPQGSFDKHSHSYGKAVSCLKAFIMLEFIEILLSGFISTVATSA